MSKQSKQTCIREGYKEGLDNLRAKWDDVEGILEDAARRTLDDLPNLATVRSEFIAHIGYHIVINAADEQYVGSGDGLEFMFAQEGMLYYKNDLMRRYDAEVGDVPSQYHDMVKVTYLCKPCSFALHRLLKGTASCCVQEILRQLEEELLRYEGDLNALSAALFEVDASIALARVAVEYDFVRPKVCNAYPGPGLYFIPHPIDFTARLWNLRWFSSREGGTRFSSSWLTHSFLTMWPLAPKARLQQWSLAPTSLEKASTSR